jgi:hypothetical protein
MREADTVSRGPIAERIDWAEPTFRVEVETENLRHAVGGCELLPRHEAIAIARRLFMLSSGPIRYRVVNERTGAAADELTREA